VRARSPGGPIGRRWPSAVQKPLYLSLGDGLAKAPAAGQVDAGSDAADSWALPFGLSKRCCPVTYRCLRTIVCMCLAPIDVLSQFGEEPGHATRRRTSVA